MDDLYGDLPPPSSEVPPPSTIPINLDVNTSDILVTAVATAAVANHTKTIINSQQKPAIIHSQVNMNN